MTDSTIPKGAERSGALADFTADRRLLLLAAMAVVAGTGGAFAAWALIRLIALVTNFVWFGKIDAGSLSLAHATRSPWMVIAPALGGLVVGLMARFGSDKIRGHGIPEAIEAILIGGSRLSLKVAVLKPMSSAIAIGTGGPFGAEGPIIMTGGAIGSLFAQGFDLTASERKTLLVAGAAAGMTAIFGTPAAAVLLAVELLLFEWRPRSLIPVTVAAVTAICWRPMLLGSGPLFPAHLVPQSPLTLPACAGAGIIIGLLAVVLSKALYATEDAFEHLKVHWMWWPMLGGVAVGLGGLVEPRALGVGYAVIGDLLAGRIMLQAVVTIFGVKAVIWLISLSSGTSGGVLAPLLILGGAAGWLLGLALPGPHALWALVGMSAMLGGALRAPLTSAVFAVELTGDVTVLPMALAGAVAAYATTVLLMKRSILTEKISRRGRHIACEYGVDPHELSRAGEVMVRTVEVLSAGSTTAEALVVFEEGRHRVYPVVDEDGRPVGLVSRADALRWSVEGAADDIPLRERLKAEGLPFAYPQDTTAQVIEQMLSTNQGRVVVVDPETGVLAGLITRKDLLAVRAGGLKLENERARFWGLRSIAPLRASGD